MINIVLYQPEMPSNAGNIIRLSVNCGARLHFVGPLGFYLDNERLMRAGLDYHELCNLTVHVNFQQFLEKEKPKRLIASTSKAHHSHVSFKFEDGDYVIFSIPKNSWLTDKSISSLNLSYIQCFFYFLFFSYQSYCFLCKSNVCCLAI